MREQKYYESLENVERIAYGMLRVTEKEFRHLTLNRIIRAMEWFDFQDESISMHTRLICFYTGNHKANSPQDLWMTEREIKRKQRDLLDGRLPMAKFKNLTPEEVKNWRMTYN